MTNNSHLIALEDILPQGVMHQATEKKGQRRSSACPFSWHQCGVMGLSWANSPGPF
jgi:hypothetical protein